MFRRNLFATILTILVLTLGPAKCDGSKVLATVNGAPITEEELTRSLKIAEKYTQGFYINEAVKKTYLEQLIDDKLIEDRLKKDGDFTSSEMQEELAMARRNAVRAYFLATKVPLPVPPTQEEVDRFSAEHKYLFSGRKFFHYTNLTFRKAAIVDIHQIKGSALYHNEKLKSTGAPITDGSNFSDMIAYLKAINEPYSVFRGYKESEEVEQNILGILESARPHELIVDTESDPNNYHVIELISAVPDPVDPKAAKPAIVNGLSKEKAVENVKKLMSDMRSGADIRYSKTGDTATEVKTSSPNPK